MRSSHGALLALLCAAAIAAGWRLDAHLDDAEATHAIMRARVHRFGPTTRARIDQYLTDQSPTSAHHWHAEVHGIFRRTSVVHLSLTRPAAHYRFSVDGDRVEALDEPTRALARRIKDWAASK